MEISTIGIVGFGRMGGALAQRLAAGNITPVAYDSSPAALEAAAQAEIEGCVSMSLLVERLHRPRVVWCMMPEGESTTQAIAELTSRLDPDDVIVDGGDSHYKNTLARAEAAAKRGVHFVDVGTSGGVRGVENGFCLTAGGDPGVIQRLVPVFRILAPSPNRGWGRVGPTGAGHFAKMVHNGIAYGMMQSIAEGFSLLNGRASLGLDPTQIAQIWQDGSQVRSWLMELTSDALSENPRLGGISSQVPDSGEGRWAVAEAVEQGVPAPVISASLMERFASRDSEGFGRRLLAALRDRFVGRDVKPE